MPEIENPKIMINGSITVSFSQRITDPSVTCQPAGWKPTAIDSSNQLVIFESNLTLKACAGI